MPSSEPQWPLPRRAETIQLISWEFLGRPSPHSILVDSPGSDWTEEQVLHHPSTAARHVIQDIRGEGRG